MRRSVLVGGCLVSCGLAYGACSALWRSVEASAYGRHARDFAIVTSRHDASGDVVLYVSRHFTLANREDLTRKFLERSMGAGRPGALTAAYVYYRADMVPRDSFERAPNLRSAHNTLYTAPEGRLWVYAYVRLPYDAAPEFVYCQYSDQRHCHDRR